MHSINKCYLQVLRIRILAGKYSGVSNFYVCLQSV